MIKSQSNKAIRSAINNNARQVRNNNKKWFLESEGFSAGPLSVGGFAAGSGKRNMLSNGDGMVGVAPRSINPQVTMPRITSKLMRGGPVDVLEGTDFLTAVSSGVGGASTGDILVQQLINPSVFPLSRESQFSDLYQRYTFEKLEFIYAPIANATQSGQLLGFFDSDVDTPLAGDDPLNINRAAAQYREKVNQIWEARIYPFGTLDPMQDYYIDTSSGSENRLVYQGLFYLLAASDIPAGEALGNIYISYRLRLAIPSLSQSSIKLQRDLFLDGSTTALTYDKPFGTAQPVPFLVDGVGSNINYTYDGTTGVFTLTDVPLGLYTLNVRFGLYNWSQITPASQLIQSQVTYSGCATVLASRAGFSNASLTLTGTLTGGAVTVGSAMAFYDIVNVTDSTVAIEPYIGDIGGAPADPIHIAGTPAFIFSSLGAYPDALTSHKTKHVPKLHVERGRFVNKLSDSVATKKDVLVEDNRIVDMKKLLDELQSKVSVMKELQEAVADSRYNDKAMRQKIKIKKLRNMQKALLYGDDESLSDEKDDECHIKKLVANSFALDREPEC